MAARSPVNLSVTTFWVHREKGRGGIQKRTCKRLGHFRGDDAERVEVRLVPDEHGDGVWAPMLAQLFDPCPDVAEG